MFKLKVLHKDAIPAAIEKAERYRFLRDSSAAESICRDILQIDPDNQQVLVMLILTLTDQFGGAGQTHVSKVRELNAQLKSDYSRIYYSGIICERWAKAQLHQGGLGAGARAFTWLREAMDWFEKADAVHPERNDEAALRWNSCARMITLHKLEPRHEDDGTPHQLE